MNTNTQTTDYKAVQNMIKQAVLLHDARHDSAKDKRPDDLDNPLHTMTDNLGEALHELLLDNSDRVSQDWNAALWNVTDDLKALLVLLTKPGVLKMLDKHHRDDAGVQLAKVIEFFESLQNSRYVRIFLDYVRCGYGADDEEMKRIQDYYDFNKRGEHKYHSHFFGKLFQEKEYLDREQVFFNKYFR